MRPIAAVVARLVLRGSLVLQERVIVREPPPDFVVAPAWILTMTVAIAAVAVMLVRLREKFVPPARVSVV